MDYWILPANPDEYDVLPAFAALNQIHWRQGRLKSIVVGDTVYIYQSDTTKQIILRTKVIDINLNSYSILDHQYFVKQPASNPPSPPPWMTLELVRDVHNQGITLDLLRNAGFTGTLRSCEHLPDHILNTFNLW